MPSRPERPLRVLHCPVNTAGIPWANVQALRRRGVDAKLVVFERYKLHPEADESLDLPSDSLLLGFARRQARQFAALARLLPRTDVFHFYFGLTLVPQSVQFPLLRALRKKSVDALPRLGHPREDTGRAGTRPQGRRAGNRQLRRDPLGAGSRGDPAGIDVARSSPHLRPTERVR